MGEKKKKKEKKRRIPLLPVRCPAGWHALSRPLPVAAVLPVSVFFSIHHEGSASAARALATRSATRRRRRSLLTMMVVMMLAVRSGEERE